MALETKINIDGNAAQVSLSGYLDTEAAPSLQKELIPVCEKEEINEIVIDMSEMPYIASAGLRVLLTAYKIVNAKGGTVEVTNLQDSVSKVLTITGLNKILQVKST